LQVTLALCTNESTCTVKSLYQDGPKVTVLAEPISYACFTQK